MLSEKYIKKSLLENVDAPQTIFLEQPKTQPAPTRKIRPKGKIKLPNLKANLNSTKLKKDLENYSWLPTCYLHYTMQVSI